MIKIINNIKKYFVYIVGTLFFIIAIYTMLIPQNCKLMNGKCSIYESFIDPDMNSIQKYKCMVGNKTAQSSTTKLSTFDSELYLNQDLMEDSRQYKKLLIFSRCYQMPNDKQKELKGFNDTIKLANFNSYTEKYILENVNEFSTVINKINDSVLAFKNKCAASQSSTSTSPSPSTYTNNIIKGAVYVLITQIPLYQDISTNKPSAVNISSSMIPQSTNLDDSDESDESDDSNKCDPVIYYSPSYIAQIANNISGKDSSKPNRSTPITYNVYIIYDLYKPGTGPDNSLEVPILPNNTRPFSKTLKSYLDANSLSSAEQCFLSAMGGSGYSYIGGCASYQGPLTQSMTNNKNKNNNQQKSFCKSPVQGDAKPWTYCVLYTVNSPYVEHKVAQI